MQGEDDEQQKRQRTKKCTADNCTIFARGSSVLCQWHITNPGAIKQIVGTIVVDKLEETKQKAINASSAPASAAKKIYKDHWDDYFTFSFIRNPWDRMVSIARYPTLYGAYEAGGKLNIDLYLRKFKNGEFDSRFPNLGKKWDGGSDTVYLQLLDEELDFIGRFENLQNDFDTVCDKVGISRRQLPHEAKSKHNLACLALLNLGFL